MKVLIHDASLQLGSFLVPIVDEHWQSNQSIIIFEHENIDSDGRRRHLYDIGIWRCEDGRDDIPPLIVVVRDYPALLYYGYNARMI
jgi:hypothetical protein